MKNILYSDVKESIKNLVNAKEGCCWYYLDSINGNNYALVFGWQDGFEPDESDTCSDGTWHISGKVAYQPSNSVMQCDYDIDWIMPYDEESGDVDDTDISISFNNLRSNLNWLKKNAQRIISEATI